MPPNNLITKLLLFLLTLLLFTSARAQNIKIDSLEKALQNHIAVDTVKVNMLNDLAYIIYSQDAKKARAYGEKAGEIADHLDYQKGKAASLWIMGLTSIQYDNKKALDYLEEALRIGEKARDNVGICNYLMAIGNVTKELGDIEKSNESFRKSLQTARQLNDEVLILKVLYNIARNESSSGKYPEATRLFQEVIDLAGKIGNNQILPRAYGGMASIYAMQGNYPGALEYYLSALKINEQMDDKSNTFFTLVNIAGIQSNQKDFNLALTTILKAFQLSKSMGDSLRMSICLTNMGNIYLSMNNPAALSCFQEALKVVKDNNIGLRINTLMNIGAIYTTQGEFDKAQANLEEALELAHKLDSKRVYGEVWIKIGILYSRQKQYNQAKSHTLKALGLAEEIKYLELQKDCHKLLSDIYAATGDFKNAYQSHFLHKTLNDSIFNENSVREIAILENTYKYEKERQKDEMVKATQALEIKGQKQIIVFLVVISAIILVLVFFIYWSNKLKKKILKLELESMSQELDSSQKATATATLKLVQSAKYETRSVNVLKNIKKDTIEKEEQSAIRSLIAESKLKSCNSNWDEFEILFEKIHPSFYDILNERFPKLTPNERKLCIFLKLNMSNNHISQITLQSEEALKKARLRLRKKLEIDRDTNLAIFIQSL